MRRNGLRRALRTALVCTLAALLNFASAVAATPPEGRADLENLNSPPGELLGAAAKLAAADVGLQKLTSSRTTLQHAIELGEEARLREAACARRLARELLLAELRGHARATSPRELVQNAVMRSGLRRIATRTLREHAAADADREGVRKGFAALDVEEAKLRGERAVAEAEVRLEQEAQRRHREAFSRIFTRDAVLRDDDSAAGGGHAHVRVAEAGGDGESEAASFASRRGALPLPVQRRCRVASRTDAAYGGPYVSITSATAGNVRAVGEGTVVFADELAPYGKLVVVDHGASYFSVYGGLSEVGVGSGGRVGEHQVVGQLAAGASLVFQLRAGSRTLTPALWFGRRRPPPAADAPAP